MHIKKITINNIRAIRQFNFELADDELAGWHVLIGDNGAGKTTILRAILRALLPTDKGWDFIGNDGPWLRRDATSNLIRVEAIRHPDLDNYGPQDLPASPDKLVANIEYIADDRVGARFTDREVSSVLFPRQEITTGFFSASFGTYRRFNGGITDINTLLNDMRLSPHRSLIHDGTDFSDVKEWFNELDEQSKFKPTDVESTESVMFRNIITLMNRSDVFPEEVRLEMLGGNSTGIYFKDAAEIDVNLQYLGSGAHSFLTIFFSIIRHMQAIYQTNELFSDDVTFIKMPGVVMIDEIDAHLHPSWQQDIGNTLKKLFPRVQFIVTTHSPLICQAAHGNGSVWRLPTPRSNAEAYRVSGVELQRLLYGDLTEAHSTELFGLSSTRSEVAERLSQELAELNTLEMFEGLTEQQKQRQAELRAAMPTIAGNVD